MAADSCFFTNRSGLRLHFVQWGDSGGVPLVLLHGLRAYAQTWEALVQSLGAGYCIYALDQRGRGLSDWATPESYHTQSYVEDLEDLVAHLQLGRFVLLGHSERRQYFGEDNVLLQTKWQHAVAAGLVPILCVGETLMQREAGEAEAVVAEQLSLLAALKADTVAVAYEPVWAIGTGQVATVAQIGDMHGFIYRQILSLCGEGAKIRVLYGGSVNAENAAAILAVPGVDGALVGGASLQAAAFATIIDAAQQASRLAV